MQPAGMDKWELRDQPHPFIATEVTDKGIDRLCEYVAAVRDNIGYEMPLLDGSPRPHRRKVRHPAGQGLREVQSGVDGGRDSLVLHRSA
jgi:hypothetical protein